MADLTRPRALDLAALDLAALDLAKLDGAVEQFHRDGVVVLRGLLDADTLALLAEGVEHNRVNPSPWSHWYTSQTEAVGFWSDYVTWPNVPQYQQVMRHPVLSQVARALMGSSQSRFFHEHVLVKEPGASERTPWHHDQPYYCVDGDQNVSMWIGLDPVGEDKALQFIAGSHRWGRWFVPRRFIDHVPYADAQERFEILPEFDEEIAALGHTVISTPTEPGDVVCFHFRTVHGASANLSATRRRAVSLRWIGDDATFTLRPWLHSPPFEQESLTIGGPLDDERFPLIP
jgi:ectoine hydroxylase-related dioxygenase (phytanoyl-CoA dioxygenase family)